MAILPDQSTIVVNELFEPALATEKKRKCGTIMAALSNDDAQGEHQQWWIGAL
jgi:hypothetical protein